MRGECSSYYPYPMDQLQSSTASAPPFAPSYGVPDYPQIHYPTPPPSYNPTQQAQTFSPSSTAQTQNVFFPHDSYGSCSQPPTQPMYPPYDAFPSNPYSHVKSLCPSMYPPVVNSTGSPVETVKDQLYEDTCNYRGENLNKNCGVYGRNESQFGSTYFGDEPERIYGIVRSDESGDGVYAYEGGKVEPYGARGTSPNSSIWSGFDDYGRSTRLRSDGDSSGASSKIFKAIPMAETPQDGKCWVQKFRVKLLAESKGQNMMDVLCQIALDGIRMLDPGTSRTLRIYPLGTITKCEIIDSSILAFWSKSNVDIEPRRIRLQSNSYTTNALLDTVTAATVQFKEIGEGMRTFDSSKIAEQTGEKKKGFGDWMNLMKPANEEKDHWVPDEAVSRCSACMTDFSAFVRKHHCRNCGDIFCDKCTHGRIALTADENAQTVRVCDRCLAEVTQRLTNAKEAASKHVGLQSHEDIAKKLQEEMEKNRKDLLSGFGFDDPGRRTREMACPTCTVRLQVQVPISGAKKIECGVCQHSFHVGAR